MNKIKIYCMYDIRHKTWNIMDSKENNCIFYGDIDCVEKWIVENKETYDEEFR